MFSKTTVIYVFLISLFFFPLSLQAQNKEKPKTVSIIGTGDIMLGSNYPSDNDLPPNEGKDLFQNVKTILQDADVTFGNLEGCFLNEGGAPKACKSGCYFFRMPDKYVNHLLDAGFDVMNIANNHMGDFGQEGRMNTVKVLRDADLNFAGLKDICETTQFEINGIKYGFCGFAPNSGTVKITEIQYAKKLVSALNSVCDVVIVSFHGGAEGKSYSRVTKKIENFYGENRGNVYEFAHAVIDAGADIVFGHGPHVVRAVELYKDRFIAYSLGNFCTSGSFSISGISGYAPIVKITTTAEGKFISGQIISALQLDKTGPVLDEKNLVVKEIKRLTELDFPNTNLIITEEGNVSRKKEGAENIQQSVKEVENSLQLHIATPKTSDNVAFSETTTNSTSDSIIDMAKQYLGLTYRRGGKGPNAFDCSGFTGYIYKHFGYSLGASCVDQVTEGERVDKDNLKAGDLIFFKGRSIKSQRVGHVGIVISNEGNGNLKFIHASCNKGITIDQLNISDYYKNRYVTGLRVLKENY